MNRRAPGSKPGIMIATTAAPSPALSAPAAPAPAAGSPSPAPPAAARSWFIPEPFTPLFHTRAYAELTPAQRLRYNQLHALYFNEQIMFFEIALGEGILEALLRRRRPARGGRTDQAADPAPRLAAILARFRDEERAHTEMFRRLNRSCAPRLYERRDFHFVRLPAAWRALLAWALAHPALFPLFFWLMLLQEERSIHYSRGYLRHRASLDPRFVEAHRRHLADEVWHVRWDEELIDALWRPAHPRLRAANARLLAWMVEEFFGTPKRAQLRVLAELAREHPELRRRLPELRRQLLALGADPRYRRSLYSREIAPATFDLLDRWPELRRLRLWEGGGR